MVHALAADPAAWRLMLMRRREAPLEMRTRIAEGRAVALEQINFLLGAMLPDVQLPKLTAELVLGGFEHLGCLLVDERTEVQAEDLVELATGLLGAVPGHR
ncbi:MAG: hypothetical protein J2O48_10865, partial [Solirubrobacterales bacterium]|nr:hypothetical protein [Solirubrobacterales bacterium]